MVAHNDEGVAVVEPTGVCNPPCAAGALAVRGLGPLESRHDGLTEGTLVFMMAPC